MSTSPAPFSLSRVRAPRRRRWPRVVAWLIGVSVALGAVGAGATWWYADSLVGEFRKGDKAQVVDQAKLALGTNPVAAPEISATTARLTIPKGTETFLLIGSDTRASADAGRSDTMILMRLDRTNNTISMLSIPRDLEVQIPGYGTNKINAAFSYGGAKKLIETVRDEFEVPIDHFAIIDFRGFRKVVDAVGGVYLTMDQRYYNHNDGSAANNYADIDLHPGYQRLTGRQALSWVRFRHKDSDFFRAARQQLFLRELKRQLTSRSNVPGLPQVMRAVAKSTTSDLDSVSETLELARVILDVPPSRVFRITLESSGGLYGGIYYTRSSDSQKRQAMQEWLNPLKHHAAPKPQATSEAAVQRAPAPAAGLLADTQAAGLVKRVRTSLNTCVPTKRPSGLSWASDEPVRSYEVAGKQAVAYSQTLGSSGRGVVWMFTDWTNAPILADVDERKRINGHTYDLYYENGKLRMVAWKSGTTRAWLTNSLRNELSSQSMLAMAVACK